MAELHEAKQIVERMAIEEKRRKADSQIIVKSMQHMESEIKSVKYLKREK
jgi:hypothetical protein